MSIGNKQQLSEMSNNQSKRTRGRYHVILNNDTVNTFDHVIDCLIEICGHNYYQAVQCATIVHNNGKCSVAVDTLEECEFMHEEMLKQGLDVDIQKMTNK